MTEAADAALVAPGHDIQEAGDALPVRAVAWRILRRSPLFWISAVLIFLFLLMAAVPGWFPHVVDPRSANLMESLDPPSSQHWFGLDGQGYDLYSRCIYGARASILVGVLATLGTSILGVFFGLLAGYMGGVVDGLLSRVSEIFFALPLLLGAIIFLQSVNFGDAFMQKILEVVTVLVVLGWPSVFRLSRSSVIQVKPQEYVQAARALGGGPLRIALRHILPNSLGPVIVVSTINLGVFIGSEAALSFLGIGLQPPTVSWGIMVDAATHDMRTAPMVLLFPSIFLSLAVLAFIMMGDAIRDAFDPKAH